MYAFQIPRTAIGAVLTKFKPEYYFLHRDPQGIKINKTSKIYLSIVVE
jgi:hypothetical protein